jgi:hypothetical protein
MTVRGRTGSVVLGLLVVLATMLGAACLCAQGYAMRPVAAVSSPSASHQPDGGGHGPSVDDREHACAAPGHDRCGGKAAVDTPVTRPGPHPQPQSLPAQVDTRPASVGVRTTVYGATPRPPNLHALQVLRT